MSGAARPTTLAVFYCENQHYAPMLEFSPDRRKKKIRQCQSFLAPPIHGARDVKHLATYRFEKGLTMPCRKERTLLISDFIIFTRRIYFLAAKCVTYLAPCCCNTSSPHRLTHLSARHALNISCPDMKNCVFMHAPINFSRQCAPALVWERWSPLHNLSINMRSPRTGASSKSALTTLPSSQQHITYQASPPST
jgi:hypothetical protein